MLGTGLQLPSPNKIRNFKKPTSKNREIRQEGGLDCKRKMNSQPHFVADISRTIEFQESDFLLQYHLAFAKGLISNQILYSRSH